MSFPYLRVDTVGNLTADPELRFTPSGVPVANFRMIVNTRVKGADGQWTDGEPSAFTVTAWKNLAENIAQTLRKGMQVHVSGPAKIREYQRKDGTEGRDLEVTADACGPNLQFLTGQLQKANPGGGGGGNYAPGGGGGQQQAPPQNWGGSPQGGFGNAQATPSSDPWGGGQATNPGEDEPPF